MSRDPLWLALGTLTALPVPPPGRVDRRTAGRAMALAPLAGVVLGVFVVLPLLALEWWGEASPLLMAALVVGALALLTRGMHLDGLADTADGLGSGRRGEDALAIMKRSDIGPFGVATLVLTLLVQVAALSELSWSGAGPAAVAVALLASRAVLPVLCTARFVSARPDGLGATVAGTVSARLALTSTLLAALLAVLSVALLQPEVPPGGLFVALAVAAVAGPVAGVLLAVHAGRRFGGVTGDVYGAAVETGFTACLMVAAIGC
ncbi:adenosylcobinamide-GDP ribazoletransferase [Nocardioides pacificus]